jgi:hypothetical protein
VRCAFVVPAVLTSLLSFSSQSSAQSAERPSWTIGATAGGGQTWDDEGSIGKGWLLGGYAARRISRHVDMEFSVDLLRHERNTGPFSFQAEGHTTYLNAALVRRFGPPRSNFFLLGGGTVGIHNGKAGSGDMPALNDADSTNVGFIFGAGGSFLTTANIEIAPLVRMTWMEVSDDSDPFSSIMAGVRVGFGR